MAKLEVVIQIRFCSVPFLLNWPFTLHPELTKNRWSGVTPLALELNKAYDKPNTNRFSSQKKSSEVFQEFANSGSHTAVHGNCCYDKKRYRVTSAVRTLHNQLERNAKHYHAIYTCCSFFLFFFWRDWRDETDLDTLREIQACTNQSGWWRSNNNGREENERKGLLAQARRALHNHYPPILGQVALAIRPAERSTCARLIVAIVAVMGDQDGGVEKKAHRGSGKTK